MCSIFGSYDVAEFNELANLNSHRGQHSFSTATYDGEVLDVIEKSLGKFKSQELDTGNLYIGHVQSPTTNARSITSVHPSVIDDTLLWHNGIIKEKQLRKWNYHSKWDTACLHKYISSGLDKLGDVDGSFACVYYKEGKLYIWRNENCPMFVNGSSFSSVKFKNAVRIEADIVYKLDGKNWVKTDKVFTTINKFYWSPAA